jgi:hypothetical protein
LASAMHAVACVGLADTRHHIGGLLGHLDALRTQRKQTGLRLLLVRHIFSSALRDVPLRGRHHCIVPAGYESLRLLVGRVGRQRLRLALPRRCGWRRMIGGNCRAVDKEQKQRCNSGNSTEQRPTQRILPSRGRALWRVGRAQTLRQRPLLPTRSKRARA